MRNAIGAGLTLLLFGAGIACAQTAVTPATSAPPATEPGRFSISAEALLWWFKDSPAPVPLVTDGLVGQPGTKTFLGGEDLDTGANPGFRLTAGYAFTERWGVEGSYFYIPSRSTSRSVSSSGQLGSTDLIVPFIDATTGQRERDRNLLLPHLPRQRHRDAQQQPHGRRPERHLGASRSGPLRVDLLGGFRWLRLHETYTLTTSSPFIPPFPQDIWNTTDEFGTINNFYGAQARRAGALRLGALLHQRHRQVRHGRHGAVRETSAAPSSPTTTPTSARTQTFSGGYFALPTNIGHYAAPCSPSFRKSG